MIAPYRRPPIPRDVALLDRGGLAHHENGSRFHPAAGDKINVYTDHLVAMSLAHRGLGSLDYFNATAIRWISPAGAKVTILPTFTEDRMTETLAGLVCLRDFLAARGASGTSITSMSFSLLRAVMTIDVPVQGGDAFTLPQIVGGRQESVLPDGAYGSFVHVDLRAAYARTLGELCYSGSWTIWPHKHLPEDPTIDMLVRARVKVPPDITFGPLPRRTYHKKNAWERRYGDIEYPRGTTFQGIWSLAEILAARQVGAEVRVIEARIGSHVFYPFKEWMDEVMKARKLPGFAGEMGKMLGNTLVGRFMMDAYEHARVSFNADNTIAKVAYPANNGPPRYMRPLDAAELVTGRVRSRLYSELMVPYAKELIGVHTDGGLLQSRRVNIFGHKGDAAVWSFPEDWREKESGINLRWLGPQCWSYTDADHHCVYKVSGIPAKWAARTFADLWRLSQSAGTVVKSHGPVANEEPWGQVAML